MRLILELREVSAGYGGRGVLRDVSLGLPAGQVTAVIGPNGCGKSTLARVIAGFLPPSSGSLVFLDRTDVASLPPHSRVAKGFRTGLQGGRIFPSLSVQDHLYLAAGCARLSDHAVSQALDHHPELQPLLARRAGLLSGGERQALATALVFLGNPRLVVLDEPTAGLAPALRMRQLERIRARARATDAAVLLIEHALADTLRIADQAIAMRQGRIMMRTDDPHRWLDSSVLQNVFFSSSPSDDGLFREH